MKIRIATQQRIDRLAILVDEFRRRDLTITQVADFLSLSHAGARKYVRELADWSLVTIFSYTFGSVGQRAPQFRLTGTSEQVAEFFAAVNAQEWAPPKQKGSISLLRQCQADPSRHLHLLCDDTPYTPVLHRFKPFRDGLVAALFGPAQGAHA
jgi:hypothetical protein